MNFCFMSPLGNTKIKVKFLHRGSYSDHANQLWIRQFPENITNWGKCQFIFDPDNRTYDWLVVYHDMPPQRPGESEKAYEELACNPANTLHVNYEPSTITTYGKQYLRQFGHLLSSQEPQYTKHPEVIYSQPCLPWHYGMSFSKKSYLTFDQINYLKPEKKNKIISTFCSSKNSKYTKHALRRKLTNNINLKLPELDIFGHGVRHVDDKAKALNPYLYHLAIENHFALHHWTEKLSDAFLGFCLPVYIGCTNIFDYFPEDSIILGDPYSADHTFEIITKAIRENTYNLVFPSILEARRKVLCEYNLFPTLAKTVEERHVHNTQDSFKLKKEICSRPRYWKRYPSARFGCIIQKTFNATVGFMKNFSL